METWSVSAGTTDFVVRVDEKLWLDLDCLRIAILSFVHRAQFFAEKALITLIGLPCQMMPQIEWRWIGVTELSSKVFGA